MYKVLLSFLIYIIILILLIYFDIINKYIYSSITFITFLTILFFSIIYNFLLDSDKNYSNIITFIAKISFFIISITLLILVIFFVFNFLFFSSFSFNIITFVINILIIIFGLAFMYQFGKSIIESGSQSSDIVNLLVNIIFYIPCLFINFIEYLKNQYKITTKTVWIILLIEIIIILLRFLVPFIFAFYNKYLIHNNGYIIQKEPIFLTQEKNLGVFQNYDNLDDDNLFNYNFAFSFKIWITPQPDSTSIAYSERTNLINYGDVFVINHNNNKIEILAATNEINSGNNVTNKLVRVYSSDILYQRWNSFIINYFGGTLDIFINNKLVVSKINITPILFPNKVSSGSEPGINGRIKDIIYYDKTLTSNEITSIYYN